MARIRTIKPELASDVGLAKLSIGARYTFVLLISQADDYGLLPGSQRQLLGALYPHNDDISMEDLHGWLGELRDAGLIRSRATTDGAPVIELVNWSKHQRVDNAGKSQLHDTLLADETQGDTESRGDSPRASASRRNSPLGPRTMDLGPRTNGSGNSGVGDQSPPEPKAKGRGGAGGGNANRSSPPPRGTAPRGRSRDPLFDAFVEAYGYDPRKPPPRIRGLAGDFSARCSRQSVVPDPSDWGEWVQSQKRELVKGKPAWGTVTVMHNAAERFLASWEIRHPIGASSNGHDPRFWVRGDQPGEWVLRHPVLLANEMPPPFNPSDVSTWPEDMREVYADRMHDDGTGRMFFA